MIDPGWAIAVIAGFPFVVWFSDLAVSNLFSYKLRRKIIVAATRDAKLPDDKLREMLEESRRAPTGMTGLARWCIAITAMLILAVAILALLDQERSRSDAANAALAAASAPSVQSLSPAQQLALADFQVPSATPQSSTAPPEDGADAPAAAAASTPAVSNLADNRQLLATLLGALTALVTAFAGFYFGGRLATDSAEQANTAAKEPTPPTETQAAVKPNGPGTPPAGQGNQPASAADTQLLPLLTGLAAVLAAYLGARDSTEAARDKKDEGEAATATP